jgi:hypothetical protein
VFYTRNRLPNKRVIPLPDKNIIEKNVCIDEYEDDNGIVYVYIVEYKEE